MVIVISLLPAGLMSRMTAIKNTGPYVPHFRAAGLTKAAKSK
jgi:hypothetical protein